MNKSEIYQKYLGWFQSEASILQQTDKIFPYGDKSWHDCITVETIGKIEHVIFWYDTEDRSTHTIKIKMDDLLKL
jgi:hypothetical protein